MASQRLLRFVIVRFFLLRLRRTPQLVFCQLEKIAVKQGLLIVNARPVLNIAQFLNVLDLVVLRVFRRFEIELGPVVVELYAVVEDRALVVRRQRLFFFSQVRANVGNTICGILARFRFGLRFTQATRFNLVS